MPVESFPLDRGRELVTLEDAARYIQKRFCSFATRPYQSPTDPLCNFLVSWPTDSLCDQTLSLGELTPSCKFQVTPLRDSLSVNELTTGANRGVRSSQGFKKLTSSRTDLRRAGAKNAGHRAGAGNGIRLPDFVAGS
jgi:hypothetical protein